ncbi:MAG: hypothetical protein IT306_23715 [Chloroflexi bacterium]|nr:hypothetical protein [Chloroflexota bacterium]
MTRTTNMATRRPSPRAGWPRMLVAVLLVLGLTLPSAASPAQASPAHAPQAAPLLTDAADFVPSLANLPAGFREDWSDVVGGDVQPTQAIRRAYVALDESRRLVVGATIHPSTATAQTAMDTQVNNLTRFQGWRFTPSSAYGESGFRGTRVNADGGNGTLALYRVNAITAEVAVFTQSGVNDPGLLDNAASLMLKRIKDDADLVTAQAGWPTAPVVVPGKDPEVPIAIAGETMPGAPGAEVTGSSSGSPVNGDTVVLLTVTAIDRPWNSGGSVPTPPSGMEYLTVEVQIEVAGATDVTTALTDFSVNTYDGRFWTAVSGRSPGLRTGMVSMASPARGWLSFMVPREQPALQLNWRLRIAQPTATGNDQTLVVPLVAGATASASVGTTPPPAGAPVTPPSTSPPPSANPTPAPGGGSSGGGSSGGGGGGSGGSGGRPRLQ